MGRPKEKENRGPKSINVNLTAYETCLTKGLNIADVCSAALEKAAFEDSPADGPLSHERELHVAAIKQIDKREQDAAASVDQEKFRKQNRLTEFLETTSDGIINNEMQLAIWVRPTGLTIAELKDAKLKKISAEIGQKSIDREQARLRQQYIDSQKEGEPVCP